MAARAWVSDKKCSTCPEACFGDVPEGGCFGEKDWGGGEVYDHCPVQDYRECDPIFEAYNRYVDGFLPVHGGSQNQPAVLMQMIDIVKSEQITHEKNQTRATNGN